MLPAWELQCELCFASMVPIFWSPRLRSNPSGNHPAFKQLVGYRTGNFVQEVLAHLGIFPELVDDFLLQLGLRSRRGCCLCACNCSQVDVWYFSITLAAILSAMGY